jgi:hypothetical protein
LEAVNFLKRLLGELLCDQLKIQYSKATSLYFPQIKVKDSTRFLAPAIYEDAYEGYNNYSKKKGLMSIQYEYDLVSGNCLSLALTNGLRNDQQDAKETIADITKGDLHIRDLGYITPTYLSAIVDKEAFFLNRLPMQAAVFTADMQPFDWEKLDRSFDQKGLTAMEVEVYIYEKHKIPCRLIIERVPQQEYKKRMNKTTQKAKSNKIGVSNLYKIKRKYNTYTTNVDAHILPVDIIRSTYYLRWQIELVFKTWKSFFHIHQLKKVKKERLECQLLAKLIWIIINWKLLNTSNKHAREIDKEQGVSVIIFFKRCTQFAATLKLVLLRRLSIKVWLKEMYLPHIRYCACEAAKKKNTHYQNLNMNFKT